MDGRTLRVFLACFSGSLIGLIIAHDLSTRFEYGRYMWFLGAIVGGLVAAVAVNFPRVKTAVVDSYHRTIAWQPDTLFWKAFGTGLIAIVAIAPTCALTLSALMMGLSENIPGLLAGDERAFFKALLMFGVGLILCFMLGLSICVNSVHRHERRDQQWNDDNLRSLYAENLLMAKLFNPISVALFIAASPIVVPYYAYRFVRQNWRTSLEATARGIRTFGRFCKLAYINAHSDLAVLCFIDAAIGVAVGHLYVGNILLGALVGGILGVIDFEVISVRVLKVARSRFF